MSNALVANKDPQEIWPTRLTYPVKIKTYEGVRFVVEDLSAEPKELGGLPVEFHNHELAAVDVEDEDSLRMFIAKWGMPHSPFLHSWDGFAAYREHGKSSMANFPSAEDEGVRTNLTSKTWLDGAVAKLSQSLYEEHFSDAWWGESKERQFFFDEAYAVAESEFVRCSRNKRPNEGGVISLHEVQRTIINLREICRIFAYLDGMEFNDALQRVAEDYAWGVETVSPYIVSIGEGAAFEEKLMGWAFEATEYFNACLWPLHKTLVEVRGPKAAWSTRFGAMQDKGSYSLVEALCIQFFYELDDGNPWQECGYRNCQKYFKYQRLNGKSSYCSPRRKGGTEYCCKSHGVLEARKRKSDNESEVG